MVLGDPQGVVNGQYSRWYQRFRPFEIVDAGIIIVVAGNHGEQTIAVEHGASCLIVSCDAQLLQDVIDLAKKRDCAIISAPRDTFGGSPAYHVYATREKV